MYVSLECWYKDISLLEIPIEILEVSLKGQSVGTWMSPPKARAWILLTPPGLPWDPRHRPNVGSLGGLVSYDRDTAVGTFGRIRGRSVPLFASSPFMQLATRKLHLEVRGIPLLLQRHPSSVS